MPRGEQISRQWRILRRLEGAGPEGLTIADLAEGEKAHARTIRRDVLDLQYAGFPLLDDAPEAGGAARWSVLKSNNRPVQIPFLPSELLALHVACNGMKAYAGTPFHEAVAEICRKIGAVLPRKSAEFLSDVRECVLARPAPLVDYGAHGEVVDLLNRGMLERRTVRCRYFTLYRNRRTRRTIDPYALRFHDGGVYLIGYCHLRNDIRTFALQRLRDVVLTDETFRPAEGFSVQAYIDSAFGVHSDAALVPDGAEETPPPVQLPMWGDPDAEPRVAGKGPGSTRVRNVAVRFSPAIAPLIRERSFHSTQKIEAQPDGGILLTMETSGLKGVEHWVLSFGEEAEVLAPKELREAVARRLSDAAGRYS